MQPCSINSAWQCSKQLRIPSLAISKSIFLIVSVTMVLALVSLPCSAKDFPAKAVLKLQKRPAHAKPDFNWLSDPRNGTWKRTCDISCLRSLAPMWRFAMQHHPGNIHQSFATPRYSATPCYVLIQLPNVIDTISKRSRSKKAFNTSPCHIFSKADSHSIPF